MDSFYFSNVRLLEIDNYESIYWAKNVGIIKITVQNEDTLINWKLKSYFINN
jgi:hypothetical protein